VKAVDIEFARPAGTGRIQWVLAGLMTTVTAGLLMAGLRVQAEVHELKAQAEVRLAHARGESARRLARQAAEAAFVPAYAADAWRAWRIHQFPLNAALTALESVAVVGVRVTTVDANAAEQSVRVQVEFSDYDTLMAYLRELNAGEPAERWALVQAQANAGSVAGRPIATLASSWKP